MSYTGETILPERILDSIIEHARINNFQTRQICATSSGPVIWMERKALHPGAPSVFLSSGVHGDEPAPVLTILKLLETRALDPTINWYISPMLNPTGFAKNTRDNQRGVDLNRDFLEPKSAESRALVQTMQETGLKVDLALLIHEDWESEGYYFYDVNPSPLLGEALIQAVRKVGAVDDSEEIDGMSSHRGIIRPDLKSGVEDPKLNGQWPEAFYLHFNHIAKLQFTLESASCQPMLQRIESHCAAILCAVDLLD